MKHSQHRFTFTELLVVTVTSVMLASVALLAVGEVQQDAKAVMCLNNLKQIGGAYLAYAKDNGNFSPGVRVSVPGWVDRSRKKPMQWRSFLCEGGYVEFPGETVSGVFECPAAKDRPFPHLYDDEQAYGAAFYKGYPGSFTLLDGSDVTFHAQIDNSYEFKLRYPMKDKFSDGIAPADFNLLTDSAHENITRDGSYCAPRLVKWGEFKGGSFLKLRHDRKANAAFGDGHAAPLSAQQLDELGWHPTRIKDMSYRP